MLLTLVLACDGGDDKSDVVYTSREAMVRALAATPSADRWSLAFSAGEHAGQILGLSEAVVRANWLADPQLVPYFWDGYAHGADVQGDDPAAPLAEIRRLTPREAHLPLEDGVLMHYTMRHAEDVAAVERYAGAWSVLTRRSPANGVRVGLQRALGDDLLHALDTAARYPAPWQHDLYEELGWRLGATRGAAHAGFREALPHVPQDSWCWFTHGAVRGRALHVSVEDAVGLLPSAPDGCGPMGWHALGWTLHTQDGLDRSRLEALSVGLEPPQRNALVRGYEEQLQPSMVQTAP